MNAVVCVPLKRKGITKVMLIDYEDWKRLKQYKWHITDSGYGIRNTLSTEKSKTKMVRVHREILRTKEGIDIDHINGNKLDNRRSNLRACTRSQNFQNKGVRKDNSTGYKGVSRDFSIKDGSKCWVAQLNIDKKRVYQGYFKTKEEAAKAYNEAAVKYFGEFARLNHGKL